MTPQTLTSLCKNPLKTTLFLSACLLASGAAHATTIVFSDNFDNDTLATNSGIGGGMVNRSIHGGANWSDNGNLQFNASGSNYQNRAISYTTNSWQSDGGFELTVDYFVSNTGTQLANIFSFGLISTDTDLSTYSDLNPFGRTAHVYSIGVNLTNAQSGAQAGRGLNFTDGTTAESLHITGNFVAGTVTPLVITVLNDGSGGANWSYSINGTVEASGNIESFDFSKDFRFAAFGEDNEYTKRIHSVSLTAIPEPSTGALFGILFSASLLRRRRATA